jgi:GTPase SAR1 family protein
MSASKSSKISKKTHKIIFLGDSGVGKTALIDKFANNRFEDFFNVCPAELSPPSVSIS